jgi:hypothetical protein
MGPYGPVKQGPVKFDFKQPVVIGGGALLVLLAGGLVFILTRKRGGTQLVDVSAAAIASAPAGSAALDGRTPGDRQMEQQISANDEHQAQLESEVLNRIKLPSSTRKTEVLVKHIRDSVQKDSANTTNVLRFWISEPETKRTT